MEINSHLRKWFIATTIALGALKGLYLHLIPPILGFYFLISRKKIDKYYYPMIAILGISSIFSIISFEPTSILRLLQLFLLLNFSQLLAKEINEDFLKNIFIIWIVLSFTYLAFDLNIYTSLETKSFFGISLTRFLGLTGESNYSGALLSVVGILSLYYRWYLLFFLALIQLPILGNRSGVVALSFYVIVFLLNSYSDKTSRLIRKPLFAFILLCPLWVIIFNITANQQQKDYLEDLSNGRIHTYIAYVYKGIENPLGIGYHKSYSMDQDYILKKTGLSRIDADEGSLQQHNTFIQIWSEFGLIGYALFSYFLFLCFFKKLEPMASVTLISCFLNYLFLNGLNEVAMQLIFAIGFSENINSPQEMIGQKK